MSSRRVVAKNHEDNTVEGRLPHSEGVDRDVIPQGPTTADRAPPPSVCVPSEVSSSDPLAGHRTGGLRSVQPAYARVA